MDPKLKPTIENAIRWAGEQLDSEAYPFRCLAFVEDAYEISNGIEIFGGSSAKESAGAYGTQQTPLIPLRGAFVFYDCFGPLFETYQNWGHIGLSLGDGQVIHAWNKVRMDHYLAIEQLSGAAGWTQPKYVGWTLVERILQGHRQKSREFTGERIKMLTTRKLRREEVEQIWTIDRSEVIDHIYYFENGTLVLKPEHYDLPGWPPGEAEKYTPLLLDCYDRGGWFCGIFDDARLIGVAVLENKFIGKSKDQLQLKFLHVSRAYRGQGLGQRLFKLAQAAAREKRAKRLYISATPSEHTINFYLRLGRVVSPEPDPELFELEPDDIHLEGEV